MQKGCKIRTAPRLLDSMLYDLTSGVFFAPKEKSEWLYLQTARAAAHFRQNIRIKTAIAETGQNESARRLRTTGDELL